MRRFEAMRTELRDRTRHYAFLDAVQLVKHAFGLVTDARRKGKRPALVYLFAEPATLAGRPIGDDARTAHRAEIADFSDAVAGDEVAFAAASYREWLDTWSDDAELRSHRRAIIESFAP